MSVFNFGDLPFGRMPACVLEVGSTDQAVLVSRTPDTTPTPVGTRVFHVESGADTKT